MTACCEVLVRIRYAECDAQGVVFNGRYGELVNEMVKNITAKSA